MRRIVLVLAALALLTAACGDQDETATTAPGDTTALSGPNAQSLGAEGDTSSTTSGDTTPRTVPATPCPLPEALPRGVSFDPALVRLHRATTAFAESARSLGGALAAAGDFSPGWGAREPVASAFYRMQADLYALALMLERTYAAAGATYSVDAGWAFPEGPYPLAALAGPWAMIPEFQAVALTDLFEMQSGADAVAVFEGGGVCALVAAFTAAMDQAAAESGA